MTMTEREWQTETACSQWMVRALQELGTPRSKSGRRQLRLFACGCCRIIWDLLSDDRLRDAVATAERFADGLATKENLATARADVLGLASDSGPFGRHPTAVRVAIDMAVATTEPQAVSAAFGMTTTVAPLAGIVPPADAETTLCRLVRCVFGNPYSPPAPSRRKQPPGIVALARSIDEDRAFDRLPALADALDAAGLDEEGMAAHCREPGPHLRGCWAVDRLLGMK